MKKNNYILIALLLFANASPLQAQNTENNSIWSSIWAGISSLSTTSKVTLTCSLAALTGYFYFKFYRKRQKQEKTAKELKQELKRQKQEKVKAIKEQLSQVRKEAEKANKELEQKKAAYQKQKLEQLKALEQLAKEKSLRQNLASVVGQKSFKYKKLCYEVDTYQQGFVPILIYLDESSNLIMKHDTDGNVKKYKLNSFLKSVMSSMMNSKTMVITSRAISDTLLHLLSASESKITKDIKKIKQYINETKWSCFYTDDSDLAVWVPKKYEKEYTSVLKIDKLTPVPLSDLQKVIEQTMKTYNEEEENKPKQLIELFKANKKYRLNIYLSGHGTSNDYMAEMVVDPKVQEEFRITSFLSFLSCKMNVNRLCISSSMAGGDNKGLLLKKSNGTPLSYQYDLIIGGNSSKSVLVAEPPKIIPLFFKNAATQSLEETCYNLHYEVVGDDEDLHGYAAYPIVLKQGTRTFCGLDRPAEAETIMAGHISGKSKGNAFFFDKNFLIASGKKINRKIVVNPNKVRNFNKYRQAVTDSSWKHMPIYWDSKLSISHTERYPEISCLESSVNFKGIGVLSPNKNSKSGILQFLREAFCDIPSDSTESRTITIEQLHAVNDISIQMRRARRAAKKEESCADLKKSECERLFKKSEGKEITLHNTEVKIREGKITFTIQHSETKKEFAWTVDISKEDPSYPAWNFKQVTS